MPKEVLLFMSPEAEDCMQSHNPAWLSLCHVIKIHRAYGKQNQTAL